MLAQFQSRYPTGSLISELLTIYHGKFLVRVLVQIDGVTRATGMAAAETLEEAEDKARNRAIAVMAIDQTSSHLPSDASTQPATGAMLEPKTSKEFSLELVKPNLNPSSFTTTEPLLELDYASVSPSPPEDAKPAIASVLEVKGTSKLSTVTVNQLAPEDDVFGEFGMIPETHSQSGSESLTAVSSSNVTPLVTPSYQPQAITEFETQINLSEPIDLSEDLLTIGVKLQELGWTPEQESEYLERTYGKSSRQQLTPEQVQEFRRYLELFSQTTKELKALKWSNQRGREYLAQTYNRKSRQHLNIQELQEFLEYLQTERDRRS